MSGLERELALKGKRVSGTTRGGLDKVMWVDDTNEIWGSYGCQVDISAESMLAHLYELQTYDEALIHQNQNGDLPRTIKKNVGGSRSMHYFLGVHFPSSLTDRLFEIWFCWKKREHLGHTQYVICISSQDDFDGEKIEKDQAVNFVKGETVACYIIDEISENVCYLQRIQTVKINAAAIPKKVLNFPTKQELGWADVLHDRYRRNTEVVNKEASVLWLRG